MNSNSKVVPGLETKIGSVKESIVPLGQGKAGRQRSLLNVNILGNQDKESTNKASKFDRKGPTSSANTKRNLSNKGDKEDGEVV